MFLASSSSFSAEGKGASAGRLWEMQANTGLRRQKWKLRPVPARARPEQARLLFPSLRITLAAAGVNLQISGFSHFFANARFQFRRSFAGHVAAPTDRTAGEGLEPAHF
jgi:hypothetical protein